MISRLVLINSAIFTRDGAFDCRTITLREVKNIVERYQEESGYKILSAIGHEATANVLERLLGLNDLYNRIQYTQEDSDMVICFKLKSRIPEGVILTVDEIEKVGYEFKLIRDITYYASYYNIVRGN